MTKDLAYQVRYTGAGYLDDKMNPVANLAELNSKFDTTELVKGMAVTVLNDGEGNMADFVWDGSQWIKKTGGEGQTYEAGQYVNIENNVISVTGITPDSYATKNELTAATENLATKNEVEQAVSEKADASAITEFVTSGEVETLIQEAVTGLTPTEYEAGEYISLENNVISVTGISPDSFATKDELTAATENLVNDEQLQEAVSGLASESFVIEKINEAVISGVSYEAGDYISIENNVISVTGISTEGLVTEDELTAATENLATKDELTAATENLASKDELTAATENLATKDEVTAATENLATKDELTAATENLVNEEQLQESVSGLASESFVIEKINEAVISGVSYEAGDYISIENNVISVTGISMEGLVTEDQLTAATENLASKDELTAATENLASKDELTAATENLATKDEVTAATENLATKDELTAATEDLVSEEDLENAVQNLATKDELTAATENFATKDELVVATEGLVSEQELSAATENLVNDEQLQEAVSGLASESFVIEKINEAVISGVTYEAGEYINIENNVISVTGISTEGLVTEDQLTAATENLASKDELTAATENLASKDELTAATENLATKDELTAVTENLASKDELSAATENLASKDELTAATENLATKDELTAVTEEFAEAISATTDYLEGEIEQLSNQLTAVTSEFATKDELVILDEDKLSKDEFTAATEDFVDEQQLEEAVSGLASESFVVEKINEAVLSGVSYDAGQYINIEDSVISVTGITPEDYATKDELTVATENLASKDELTAATENLATKDEVTAATENLVSKDELTAATENLATKDELTAATENLASKDELTAATENLATKDELTAATENLVSNDDLTAATENLATKDELTAATGNIEEQLEGKSDTGHTHDDRYYTQAEVDDFLATKSDTGHTHPAYSGGTNIDVDGLVISVTGLTSAVLTNGFTTQIGVGFVPSGTTFAAGTSIETILRQIFLNTSSNMALTVSLSTSDGGDLTSAAPQVTVNQDTRTWEGTPLTFLVGDGVPYQISVSNVNGYTTPSPVTGVASSAEVSRSVTMTYNRQVSKKYLMNEVDFNELMDLMDEGVIAETPVGMLYPTNFSQQYVSGWQQGTYTGTTVSVSATSQEDVNVISIAVPSGYSITSITDEDQAQEILNLFYVQNVNMTINNTPYGKIYSRTVEGGIGSFNYTFNIVSE